MDKMHAFDNFSVEPVHDEKDNLLFYINNYGFIMM